jgi:hypothetical protein
MSSWVRGERKRMLEKIKEHALSIRPTFIYTCKTRDVTINDYALREASFYGCLEVVKVLIEAGAKLPD